MLAVVTGGTRGIGKAVCQALLSEGFIVVTCARNKLPVANDERLHVLQVDLRIETDIEKLISFVKSLSQPLNILVNNAGHYSENSVLDDPKLLESHMKVHLEAPARIVNGLQDLFVPGTHVFNVGSTLSLMVREEAAFYTIAKHAMLVWSNLLATELSKRNIKVSALLPGPVHTSSWSTPPPPEALMPTEVATAIIKEYHCNLEEARAVIML